jgi:hypothetical protein
LGFPAPAIAQGIRQLVMVTDHPEGPGMLPSARRLAQTIREASGGRIRIEVSASGAVVRPFQTFDATQSGVVDMFHSHIGYFAQKSPAFHFYAGVPFGFTANELFAWVRFGGGQELWDSLCAPFDIKPLLSSSTGAQMGGWFVREMTSTQDFKGLRYRMAEPGAEVFRRLGATVVLLPGAETVQALRSGAIDACEWIGPWMDTAMGLHKAAGYYYYPGWQEPGTDCARHQQARLGKLRCERPAADRGRGGGRVRRFARRVQHQQRRCLTQAAGRGGRQDPKIRRHHAEEFGRNQQRGGGRARLRRRAFAQDPCELSGIPRHGNGLDRYWRGRLLEDS